MTNIARKTTRLYIKPKPAKQEILKLRHKSLNVKKIYSKSVDFSDKDPNLSHLLQKGKKHHDSAY